MPDGSLQWYIDELAVSEQQTATLRFTLKDRCKKTGKMPVNKSICLVDEAQESPTFPNPMITVTKDVCEDCPEAVEVTAPSSRGCTDMRLSHIRFLLPETESMCKTRTYRVRAFVNAASGTWGAECYHGDVCGC